VVRPKVQWTRKAGRRISSSRQLVPSDHRRAYRSFAPYFSNRWDGLGGVLTSFALRFPIILKARLPSKTGVTRDVSLAGDIRYEALALYRKFWL
jgi:hypothetical protein